MSAKEESDLPEVAEKRANKAALTAAELAERRGGAKENAELQSTVRTQSREAVSQAQARIREAVIRNRRDKLTALLHHLTVDVLRASFFGLKKFAACEMIGDDVGGIAVHIGARVAALAGAGEVLVSSTVKDLVAGSGLRFGDRGSQSLKGVPGEWHVFAVER